jgi:hypothetical protein
MGSYLWFISKKRLEDIPPSSFNDGSRQTLQNNTKGIPLLNKKTQSK